MSALQRGDEREGLSFTRSCFSILQLQRIGQYFFKKESTIRLTLKY